MAVQVGITLSRDLNVAFWIAILAVFIALGAGFASRLAAAKKKGDKGPPAS
ncbi:MAG: hypothetical protein ACYC2K_06980 [Gemmatimonadales bacterium]